MITKPVKRKILFHGVQKVAGSTRKKAIGLALEQVKKTLAQLHTVTHNQLSGRAR